MKNSDKIFWLILLTAIVVRIILWMGVEGSDFLTYNSFAYKIYIGDFNFDTFGDFRQVRLALFLPVSVLFFLFGVSEITSNMYPFLCSIGLVIITYKLGTILFSKKVGLISMALYSFLPIEVVYSSILLPEMPLGFFIGLSVLLFIKVEKEENSVIKPKVLLFFSGLFIGFAFLVKITGIFILGFFLLYFIYKRKFNINYLYILFGFITVLFLEMLSYYYYEGDFLFRYHLMEYANTSVSQDPSLEPAHYARNKIGLYRIFLLYPLAMFRPFSLFSLYYYGVFLSIIYFLFKKSKETYIVLLWLFVVLFGLNFGLSSIKPLIFLYAQPRYLSMASVPAVLLLGYCIGNANTNLRKTVTTIFLIALVITSTISLNFQYNHRGRHNVHNSLEIYQFLKGTKKPVFTDQRTKRILMYLNGLKPDYELINFETKINPDALKVASDCYVVINNYRIDKDKRHYLTEFPIEIYTPPKNWSLEMVSENTTKEMLGLGIVTKLKKLINHENTVTKTQEPDISVIMRSKNAYVYYVSNDNSSVKDH